MNNGNQPTDYDLFLSVCAVFLCAYPLKFFFTFVWLICL